MNFKSDKEFNNKLRILSSQINLYTNDYFNNHINFKQNIKKRKTILNDGLLFKLLYTQKNSTQEIVTSKLNTYYKKNITRTSYCDRVKQLDINFFENLNNKFSKLIDSLFYNNNNKMNIIATDGTYTQFKSSTTNNQNLNKNKSSVTCLSTCLYSVTYNDPINLKLESDMSNERLSFSNILNNEYIKNDKINNIFVFDRGYYSTNLINEIAKTNIFFICRLKKNLKIIDIENLNNDYLINNPNNDGSQLRIIKYEVKNSKFCLLTNLLNNEEFDLTNIQNIYRKRWSVEEYFKTLKHVTNFKNNNEDKLINIQKSMYCYLIISKLGYLINNYFQSKITNQPNNKNKTINKNLLFNSLYTHDFIIKFFDNTLDEKECELFFEINIKKIYNKSDRSSIIICKRSSFISYFKYNIKSVKKK